MQINARNGDNADIVERSFSVWQNNVAASIKKKSRDLDAALIAPSTFAY